MFTVYAVTFTADNGVPAVKDKYNAGMYFLKNRRAI